jgi:hypothetical protein
MSHLAPAADGVDEEHDFVVGEDGKLERKGGSRREDNRRE